MSEPKTGFRMDNRVRGSEGLPDDRILFRCWGFLAAEFGLGFMKRCRKTAIGSQFSFVSRQQSKKKLPPTVMMIAMLQPLMMMMMLAVRGGDGVLSKHPQHHSLGSLD